ncbi:uncharacterized protein LY89DRAFT_728040 [Mollisia scopiformis]|uniref:RING-type domain-containing protein n=1 Tax=Mollisia scopiformis TaxID=149040 RepID=A0A194XSV6_MOLSC|nr:uncharacterized protein LY89DRAFT_728040 [Mollisia scopiformis]KUJ23278.1 hypothetical protein LY89DRAFT_728040 [Mollisia scopiformis]
MCRHYVVIYTCGHFKFDVRLCSNSIHCNTLSNNNPVSIPFHCSGCISAPGYPSADQRSLMNPPNSVQLAEATHLWSGFGRLLSGEDIADTNRGPNEDVRPRICCSLPKKDVSRLRYWLTLLLNTRQIPQSWGAGEQVFLGKIIVNEIHRTIVLNAVNEKEAELLAVEQGNIPFLLTRIEIESLEEDNRECFICLDQYGQREAPDEDPEAAVKLPCGHCFGDACIGITFKQLEWKCPFCRRAYSDKEYRLETPEIRSPWWMEWLIRAED